MHVIRRMVGLPLLVGLEGIADMQKALHVSAMVQSGGRMEFASTGLDGPDGRRGGGCTQQPHQVPLGAARVRNKHARGG